MSSREKSTARGETATCPHCHQPLNGQKPYCESCGVDLALAAYLSENALIAANLPKGLPVTPEILVPRLGEYLIAKGLLTKIDEDRAFQYQQEQADLGHPILFGQALLALELIDLEKLDQAITEQILELQAALRQANRRLEQRVRERTRELEQALTKLTELNQLKSNFISNISHELRTPLTHIRGYVELMADETLGPVSDDQTFAVQVMQRAADRLEELVNDLLRFSKAAQGEFTLRMTALLLTPLLERTVTESRGKAEEKRISLQAEIPSRIPAVQGDEEKITWVILQLLDNAIKFTEPEGRVELSAYTADNGVTLGIKDSGIGIPPDRLAEIFEPFHQLDSSSTRKYGGTGLGLALVIRILEAHGAFPKVQSEVGAGTSLEFTLPFAKNGVETTQRS